MVENRFTDDGLLTYVTDIMLLKDTDFFVGTFTSNVSTAGATVFNITTHKSIQLGSLRFAGVDKPSGIVLLAIILLAKICNLFCRFYSKFFKPFLTLSNIGQILS